MTVPALFPMEKVQMHRPSESFVLSHAISLLLRSTNRSFLQHHKPLRQLLDPAWFSNSIGSSAAMNPFEPVATAINGVDFTFLPSAEIKKLSVKQITNPVTFDSLLHPTPGGLYDLALGSFEDNSCKTCTLKQFNGCPGHCGHIELPTKVYHPIFMDQCLRLLRAKCAFCHRLKMPRTEINRFGCKLQLAHRGLVTEAGQIDGLQVKGNVTGADPENSESEADDGDDIMETRNIFTKNALDKARENAGLLDDIVTEAAAQCRKEIIAEFMAAIAKPKRCASCKAISPGFRKDKYVKIFRVGLNAKESDKNAILGQTMKNALVERMEQRRKAQRLAQKRKGPTHEDEGVADMDSSQSEIEIELEDSESSSSEVEVPEVSTTGADIATQPVLRSKTKTSLSRESVYVGSDEVHAALSLLFDHEGAILSLIYSPKASMELHKAMATADMFFIDTLLVPPNKFRPAASRGGGDSLTEHLSNTMYKQILTTCGIIGQIHQELSGLAPVAEGRRARTADDLQNQIVSLQGSVNGVIDSTRNPGSARGAEDGIKQLLEKKEGLFRKNMMGKRVNFAARSVISPDPNLETSEIGVPPVFAMKLNYAEPVTAHNFHKLKALVLNGTDKYPGAVAIEDEAGRVVSLKNKTVEERMAIANSLLAPSTTSATGARNKKVHRHLQNGDMVIMNRQPTLHKPSMMCHRARVLPGEKTIRMHYANCNTYNADFDGDEMNMHFPQNELARAEANFIADTDHQYLSSTAGNPLRGLIQDHLSMGLQMTNRDVFFTREEYQQLLYSAMRPEDNHTTSGSIITVPPAVLKPKPLWTGKQVITTLLENIRPIDHGPLFMESKSQTPAKLWGNNSEEQIVIVQQGELICGVLDKKQIGPAKGGLVACVHEAYGETIAGRFLSLLGRLLTSVLAKRAFSCGVEDLILTPEGEAVRKELLAKAPKLGLEVAAKYVTLDDKNPKSDDHELKNRLEGVLRDDTKQAGLDELTKASCGTLSSEITAALLPDRLVKPFPKNQMQAMTNSGAKGSSVNANLISCNLGSQVLEGRRVPTMTSGKTLPSFVPYDTNIRAGGYITQRFLTGIKPQEYYFHAMAGREGLIDTAVKTSRSGYLQRCLVKGLENLKVEYDSTVRDTSSGDVIQFLYGDDGLDIAKAQQLTDFKWICENSASVTANLNTREIFHQVHSEEAENWNKQAVKAFSKTGDLAAKGRDPAINVFNPSRYCGSTSEAFYKKVRKYGESNPDRVLYSKDATKQVLLTKKGFNMLMNLKYQKSLVEPGEAIGIVAGQSVGEPSTQMTLNTFHLAGHSSKNVTLGIPRLREIVMTASANVATPIMTAYLNQGISEEQGKTIAKGMSKLTLAEVLDSLDVTDTVGKGVGYARARIYKMKLDFFPPEEYTKEYKISVNDVMTTVVLRMLPKLQAKLRAEFKKLATEVGLKKASDSRPEIGASSGRIEEHAARAEELDDGDGDDDDEGGDGDGTNAKQSARRKEMVSYEDADEDEDRIRQQAQREAMPEEHEDEAYGSREGTPIPGAEGPKKLTSATGQATQPGSDSEPEEDDTEQQESDVKPGGRVAETPQQIEDLLRAHEGNRDVVTFKFDPKGRFATFTLEYPFTVEKTLVMPHVEWAIKQTVIQAVPDISSCLFVAKDPNKTDPKEDAHIAAEGINFPAIWDRYPHLFDVNRLYCNSVAHMLTHYGVEAARATIIAELRAVFEGHGISVDPRHLMLIADTMTRGGGYRAFNRSGLMKNMVSAFAKMSFETTVGFLKDAVLEGEREDLRNPSARIVVGKLSGVGTGGFDVLTRVPVSSAE